jgi:hypothetical protein
MWRQTPRRSFTLQWQIEHGDYPNPNYVYMITITDESLRTSLKFVTWHVTSLSSIVRRCNTTGSKNTQSHRRVILHVCVCVCMSVCVSYEPFRKQSRQARFLEPPKYRKTTHLPLRWVFYDFICIVPKKNNPRVVTGENNRPTVAHAGRKRRLKWVLGAGGYNWVTQSPGDIETWSSRSGVGRGADDPTP